MWQSERQETSRDELILPWVSASEVAQGIRGGILGIVGRAAAVY